MHGDYDEPDTSELGRTPFDWQIAAVGVLAVGLFVFSFFAGGGCAQGGDPVADALADLKADKAVRSAMAGLRPTQQPTPPGAMTIPAPVGGPAPDPFAGGSGTIPTIPAITAVRPSTSSPDPVRLPGHIRIGVPGAAIRGFTDGCASPFG